MFLLLKNLLRTKINILFMNFYSISPSLRAHSVNFLRSGLNFLLDFSDESLCPKILKKQCDHRENGKTIANKLSHLARMR